jgi:diguanylate cyclase (GGDEF)-like protein
VQRNQNEDGEGPGPERIALNLAPFAGAWALAAATVLVGTSVSWPQYAIALVLGAIAGAWRLAPWPGMLAEVREVVPSLIFLVAVAFLRSSSGGANSGAAVVALLPVFWTALHGNRRQLSAVIVGLAVFFFAPLIFVGAPAYPLSQYRAGILFLAVGTVIGFSTQRLMAHVRFQASEAEYRERMLERVAALIRGLGNSPNAREEVCQGAMSIGRASFAVLFEPADVPGTLRSTALAGVGDGPVGAPVIEVRPSESSPVRDVFVSRRSRLLSDGEGESIFSPELWESAGRPVTVLVEPVFRGSEPVGVLVVGWHESVRQGGSRATAIALLAHEVAAAVERADLLTQLTDMASTDALTGLPNRRAWENSLAKALASGERLAVAMLDFDRFKDFNDTRGHPAGDRLLKESAAAWRTELRTGDLLARLGGDEFALLLPNCPPEAALVVVERLRKRIPYEQTCSAGIAIHVADEPAELLMTRVDETLYAAKASGRDCVSLVS